MISSLPQLNLLQKSVKLTALLQSFHTFSSCLSDLSWLFTQSLDVIQQFSRESSEYYRDRKSKRIRIDNIQKEYLTLKLRFDSVDINQIQMFIRQLVKQQSQRRKSSCGSIAQSSTSSRRDKKQNQSNTFRQHPAIQSSRTNFIQISERQTIGKKEQQLSQKLLQSNEQMKHLNYQIARLKQQNGLFREQILQMKKQVTLLTDIVYNKRINQLNVIEKIKGVIKVIKEKNNSHSSQLDYLLYGLIDYESRLKQNAKDILAGQYYEPLQSQQMKRNNLMLEINTMMRQINDLTDQKRFVEEQIEQLGELWEQKKNDGKTLQTNNTLGCNCGIIEPGNDHMLLLQAMTIQRLLGSN